MERRHIEEIMDFPMRLMKPSDKMLKSVPMMPPGIWPLVYMGKVVAWVKMDRLYDQDGNLFEGVD